MRNRMSCVTSFIGLFLCTATVVGCSSPSSVNDETASSSDALSIGGPIKGVPSGRCLDIKDNSSAPGQPMQIWDCNGQANQRFVFTAAGELRTFDGTLCVQPKAGVAPLQAPVLLAACGGQVAQQWRSNADKTITHGATGMCLDVKARATANGTAVQIYTCTGGPNQKFTVTAPPDSQPPTVPGGLTLSNLTCSGATLAWTASTDNVGVAFYDVYHDGQLIKSVAPTALTTDVTVLAGVTWGFYVNARDAAGNVSQASTTVSVTPPQCQVDTTPPSTPTGLRASASGTSVTLTWTASTDDVGVKAYDVYRDGATKVGTVLGTATTAPPATFVDSGLAPNTTYAYAVVARDAQANASPASASVTATTGAACSNAICGTTQVATETDIPWGVVPLADGTLLYSRRDVHDIVRLNPTTGAKTTVGAVPNVESTDGEGGLLGLAVSPQFASDRWLYILHTSPTDNRIVRIKVTAGFTLDLATEQILASGLLRNKFHNGGRLRFGPDGKLYATMGDAQNGANARNTGNLNGKVLRLNPDGSVPSDNPFGNFVWSYGHRNPQGLAFDSQGRLWEQEFGNSVMDETNLIVKGGNYGWPDCEGTTSQGGSGCATAGYIAPKRTYPTADGSCSGIAIVRDVLYVACERGTRLYREEITGSSLTNVSQLFVGTYGRLRTVEPTIDGNLWLTTTNTGDKDSVPNNSNEKILKVLLGN